jgi:hypothetical protein
MASFHETIAAPAAYKDAPLPLEILHYCPTPGAPGSRPQPVMIFHISYTMFDATLIALLDSIALGAL